MNESNSFETSPIMSAHKDNFTDKPKACALSQEKFDDQIKNCIAPLTKLLEELTRLIQGNSTALRPIFFPRANKSAGFSEAGPSPNIGDWRHRYFARK